MYLAKLENFAEIFCDSPKVVTKLQTSATSRDKSRPNRAKIAASLFTRFEEATCARQNCIEKCAGKKLQKLACENGS